MALIQRIIDPPPPDAEPPAAPVAPAAPPVVQQARAIRKANGVVKSQAAPAAPSLADRVLATAAEFQQGEKVAVSLHNIRDAMPEVPRDVLDKVFEQLQRDGRANLLTQDNPAAFTKNTGMRDGGFKAFGEDKHLLWPKDAAAAPEQPSWRKAQEAPQSGADAPDDGPVPFSTTLKHAKIDHRDYAVADQAAAEFAQTGKPAHVVGRYRESTAFRQARERDRLLEMSKDPAFPHDDVGFQELVASITKVRDREDVAQLVKDVMQQYPAHGSLAHRYFHPAWAASLWTKSKSSRKGQERATSTAD